MVNYLKSQGMELLLNLAWLTMVLTALWVFLRRRRSCAWTAGVPYAKALLAIGCVLVLLFPVVSASDDLHPTQAVVEDANKRIHQLTASLQNAQGNPGGQLPVALVVFLLCSLSMVQWRRPGAETARVIVRERLPRIGRAPPCL